MAVAEPTVHNATCDLCDSNIVGDRYVSSSLICPSLAIEDFHRNVSIAPIMIPVELATSQCFLLNEMGYIDLRFSGSPTSSTQDTVS